jgi:penicillin-binding protein 2
VAQNDPIRSLDQPLDQPSDPGRRRLLGLGLGAGLGFLGLGAQLWRLQVFNGADYRQLADNNRFRLRRVDALRGVIFDRNEQALARNRASYTIAVVPADLPRPPEPVLHRLGSLIGATGSEIARLLAERQVPADPFSPVPIRTAVDPALAHAVEERNLELPGVQIVLRPVREYVDGQLLSHLIGFVGRIDPDEFERLKGDVEREYALEDQIGKMGLELTREPELRGRPGQKRTEVDSVGRELRVLGVDRAHPGQNLVLTIDLPLQREITRVLGEELHRFEAASAVAIDPRNGQVLAMVHLPSFDNNLFSRAISDEEFAALLKDPRRPLVNGAIAEASPPGSIFKVVTAVAALQHDVIKADTKFECTGALTFPSREAPGGIGRIPCWAVHGTQDVATALANSCNVFFYRVGGGDPRGEGPPGVGIDRLGEWAKAFGLGGATGIELPNEIDGFFPTQAWKRRTFKEPWVPGDTYNVSIGQGYVTATPIQFAVAYSAIANGGRVYQPQILLKTTDERGATIRDFEPRLERDLHLDPKKLESVQRGLRYGMQIGRTENGTTYTGTSWQWDLRDLAVAGKTGTAEWGSPDVSGHLPTHAWFAGYAPFEAPQIALSIFLRRGRGPDDAARLARRIFAFYFGVQEV